MADKKTETKAKAENVEREFIIPLRKRFNVVPRYRKTNKAIKAIKEFLVRHMKVYDRDLNKIKIDKYLNEQVWSRGIKNPPSKIKVKAIKDKDGIVRVELVDYPENLKFKKLFEEKREREGGAGKKKKEEIKQPEENKDLKEEEVKKENEKETSRSVEDAGKAMEKQEAKKMKQEPTYKVKQPKHQFRKALKK